MGDMEQLRQLVADLMKCNIEAQVAADQRQRDLLQQLIAARPDAAAIRAEEIARLGAVLRESVKIKDFKEEYGPKVTQVGEVLSQFGSGRFKKPREQSVASFTQDWLKQLPECMMPTTDGECRDFVDLIKRALFYCCLDDRYIQKELCEMEGEPSFKSYFDQAVMTEQKRNSLATMDAD